MNKSICILRSNPVKPDSRVEKEAFILKKNDYDVCIFAWDRDSNHEQVEECITVGRYNIPVIRVGYQAAYGAGFQSLIPYLKFQFKMRRFLKDNHFDVVHACDFDTAFFTHKLVKRKKEKLVFDIFDILGDDERTIFQKILKKTQIRIINRADATIVCTEERKKQIEGSCPKRVVVIHNTPSAQQFVDSTDVRKDNGFIRVCYVGILQNGRLLREVGEFFSKHPEIELHIGGFGYLESFFIELSQKHPNIKFYGKLSYQETLKLENSSDIMIAIYDPSVSNHRFAAPNKFYESLFLGKPVIMVKETGMSYVVKENDIGELIDYSKEGFEKGLLRLIDRKDQWGAMSTRMKEIYKHDYSGEEMEKRMKELYLELI